MCTNYALRSIHNWHFKYVMLFCEHRRICKLGATGTIFFRYGNPFKND